MAGITELADVSAVRLDLKGQPPMRFGATELSDDLHEHARPVIYFEDGKTHNLGTLTLIKDLSDDRAAMARIWVATVLGNAGDPAGHRGAGADLPDRRHPPAGDHRPPGARGDRRRPARRRPRQAPRRPAAARRQPG
ncbi:hypothetical protein [Zoogloea sp. 1C4]|uniref:hypothetical protein n=1 Tax=Zoogloea sp. 1C4 TaxID=2570190 RepID=UPI001D176573|nr:hypothetical protein [Zoogloea sp. 1C4]